MPASRMPTVSSEVATGRRMNVRDGLTGGRPLAWRLGRARAVPYSDAAQPRPTNGIFVAMTVRNRTLASSGRLAM